MNLLFRQTKLPKSLNVHNLFRHTDTKKRSFNKNLKTLYKEFSFNPVTEVTNEILT